MPNEQLIVVRSVKFLFEKGFDRHLFCPLDIFFVLYCGCFECINCLPKSCGTLRKEELEQVPWTWACRDGFVPFSSHSLSFRLMLNVQTEIQRWKKHVKWFSRPHVINCVDGSMLLLLFGMAPGLQGLIWELLDVSHPFLPLYRELVKSHPPKKSQRKWENTYFQIIIISFYFRKYSEMPLKMPVGN